MTTDHRAQAEALTLARPFDATEHLLAAIQDGQAEQTEWLHRIRDLLAVMAEPKGDPCPCGCRLNMEPKPLVSRNLTEMQERINATLADPAVDAALNPGTHDRIGSRCTRVGCLELHDPEPESVTVSLPRTQFMDASTVRRLAEAHLDPGHCHAVTAGIMTALADALDAVSATQEADQ